MHTYIAYIWVGPVMLSLSTFTPMGLSCHHSSYVISVSYKDVARKCIADLIVVEGVAELTIPRFAKYYMLRTKLPCMNSTLCYCIYTPVGIHLFAVYCLNVLAYTYIHTYIHTYTLKDPFFCMITWSWRGGHI